MRSEFTNKALGLITSQCADPVLLKVLHHLASDIDADIDRLSAAADNGFKPIDSPSSIYRGAIQKLQLFNGTFESGPIKELLDDMWSAVYEFKSKV